MNTTSTAKMSSNWRLRTLHIFVLSLFFLACNSSPISEQSSQLQRSKRGTCEDTCTTPGCVHAASSILKNMNPAVDPCDNFYKFACGGFLDDLDLSNDKSQMNTFDKVAETVLKQLRNNLEFMVQYLSSLHKVQRLYFNCMNTTFIEEEGLTPIKNILTELGGWPVIVGDAWNPEDFTWYDFVYKCRNMGFVVSFFIDMRVKINVQDTSRYLIDVNVAGLNLFIVNRKFFKLDIESKFIAAYYNLMVDIAVILGADRTRAKEELKEAIEFESKLLNNSLSSEERHNATLLNNQMTLNEVIAKYPSIPWKDYISKMLDTTTPIDGDELINIQEPEFISGLETLLASTPKRVQANYALWRVISSTILFSPSVIRKRDYAYKKEIFGVDAAEPRWMECTKMVSHYCSIGIGSMYIRSNFKTEAKKNMDEMVKDIQHEFENILKQGTWMDEKTKAHALDKFKLMTSHIGYPQELLDNKKIEDVYANVEITPGSYLKSVLNMTKFHMDNSFNRFRTPVNKTDWLRQIPAAMVNAYYSPKDNSIQFPAGIMQGPFYSNDRPNYLNYGAIGYIIGHEITHGFDDIGRQFDKDGRLVDWWEPETQSEYLNRTACIIQQYSNYKDGELALHLNGINTQGENIADNVGVKTAYSAYKEWVKRHGVEQQLPGLPYNGKQLFWLGAANTWCGKYKHERLLQMIITDEHSPNEFRIIGPLSNMKEFADDFNCAVGSKMNPVKKCEVF